MFGSPLTKAGCSSVCLWPEKSACLESLYEEADTRLGALDAGAHGIVVPLLKTAEDARKVVDSCKFPPQGSRGFGSPFPMQSFGDISQLDYLRQANESLVTVIQIETREALASTLR